MTPQSSWDTAPTAMILTARGPEQQSQGVNNVLAFINLALALGKAGKPYCGYGCLTGQGNGQGGREHGQKADQLPGYGRLDNPEHRAHIARVWGIAHEDLPARGKSAYEMLDALGSEGGVRALLVFGSNSRFRRRAPDISKSVLTHSRFPGGLRLLPFRDSRTSRRRPSFGPMG